MYRRMPCVATGNLPGWGRESMYVYITFNTKNHWLHAITIEIKMYTKCRHTSGHLNPKTRPTTTTNFCIRILRDDKFGLNQIRFIINCGTPHEIQRHVITYYSNSILFQNMVVLSYIAINLKHILKTRAPTTTHKQA